MSKSKSDAPDADPASTNEKSYSQQPDTNYYEPGFFADVKATPRKICTMFFVNPDVDIQTLLGSACESLASASVMTMDVADHTEGTNRNTLLGITQVLMLAELAVNRALDQLDPIE